MLAPPARVKRRTAIPTIDVGRRFVEAGCSGLPDKRDKCNHSRPVLPSGRRGFGWSRTSSKAFGLNTDQAAVASRSMQLPVGSLNRSLPPYRVREVVPLGGDGRLPAESRPVVALVPWTPLPDPRNRMQTSPGLAASLRWRAHRGIVDTVTQERGGRLSTPQAPCSRGPE